jgi:hypothetical protein
MKQILCAIVAAFALAGCARFTTTQTETRGDKNGETTEITTRVTATTFFDSRSALANFKASQTEKTQGASVGSLTQDAASTNLNTIVESVTRGAVEGAFRAVKPVP